MPARSVFHSGSDAVRLKTYFSGGTTTCPLKRTKLDYLIGKVATNSNRFNRIGTLIGVHQTGIGGVSDCLSLSVAHVVFAGTENTRIISFATTGFLLLLDLPLDDPAGDLLC